MSVANITLHNIILPIADKLNESIIFKRYIDDVIWISETELLTNDIKASLADVFVSNGLKLTFRRISTNQPTSSLEFLDINHVIDTTCRGGFYTTDFKKPTAINRRFLHGLSHHPRWIFKSIIFSESTRLRRLNEKHGNYLTAIEALEKKCIKFGFNKNLVLKMTKITKEWVDRFSPPKLTRKKPFSKFSLGHGLSKFIETNQKRKRIEPRSLCGIPTATNDRKQTNKVQGNRSSYQRTEPRNIETMLPHTVQTLRRSRK